MTFPLSDHLSSLSVWILRTALAARALGLGYGYLWHPMERESDIFGTLFFEWGTSEPFAQRLEDLGVWLYVISAAAVLLVNWVIGGKGRDRFPGLSRYWRLVEIVLLTFCIAWELLFAGAISYRGGEFLSQLAIGSNGLRIVTPLCLLLLALRMSRNTILQVLRWGVALTFLVHGIKAWQLSPWFITMVIGTSQNLLAYDPPQAAVETMLRAIGLVDTVAAALLLGFRNRWLALYMTCWGLLTALGRTTGAGWTSYPETLLRLAHAGGPLVLFLEWSRQRDLPQASETSSLDTHDTAIAT